MSDRNYYYNKLYSYLSKENIDGNITEEEMESKLDQYNEMSTMELSNECENLGIKKIL
jgi:hypothetical protein